MSDLGDTKSVNISILGPVRILRDSVPVDIGAARLKALLVLLCIRQGQPVGSERLIDELWEEDPPAGAKATLQSYISNLRRALGSDVILTSHGGYRLGPSVELDLDEFEACVNVGQQSSDPAGLSGDAQRSLKRASEIWRGSFAEDVRPLDRLERYAQVVNEQRLGATTLWLETMVDSEPEQAITKLRSLRSEYPMDEKLLRLLMRSLVAVDRRAEALRVCHEFRLELLEQSGIGPSPALQKLESSIAAEQELPQPAKPVKRLPDTRPVLELGDSFIGRQDLFDRVRDEVLSRRLVTLVGPGGVGKSRIAVEVLDALKTQLAHVAFCDLSEAGSEQPLTSLVQELRDQTPAKGASSKTVVLLDGCERVASDVSDVVRELLRYRPDIHIVATSRCRLNVASGRVVFVPPLSTVCEQGDVLSPAARLLVDRVESLGQHVDNDDWPCAETIATATDGLPVLLELAAEQVAGFGLKTYASEVSSRLVKSSSNRFADGHRHQSARSLMGWTLDRLSPEHRRLIVALTLFEGSFTLQAAEVIAEAVGITSESVFIALIDQSLVSRVVDGKAVERYVILPTLRKVLEQEYRELGVRQDVERSFITFFAKRAREVVPSVRQMSAAQRSSLLDPDRSNLLAGLELAQQYGTFAEGVDLFWTFLWHCHELDDLVNMRRWILESLEGEGSSSSTDETIARGHVSVVAISFYLSLTEGISGEADLAVSHARKVNSRWLLADALSLQGATAINADDLSGAFDALTEASEVCESIGHIWGLAVVDVFRAIAERRAQRFELSYQFGRKALERLVYVEDKRAISLATRTVARTLHDMGKVADAQDMAARSYEMAMATEDHVTLAMAALAYGQALASVENLDLGRSLFLEALQASIKTQNMTLLASSLGWIAFVDYSRLGDAGMLAFVDGFTSQYRPSQLRPSRDAVLAKARKQLGSDLFDMERLRGRNASLEVVLDRLNITFDS